MEFSGKLRDVVARFFEKGFPEPLSKNFKLNKKTAFVQLFRQIYTKLCHFIYLNI